MSNDSSILALYMYKSLHKSARHALLVVGGVAALLIIANVLLWSMVVARTTHATSLGVLTVAVLDVGQGDAIYIESPSGKQVLIDGGPDSSVLRELPKVMPNFDRSLDVVVETHTDADHIGGLPSVLERYDVGMFIEPGMYKDTQVNEVLESIVDSRNVPRYIARAGQTLDLGDGVVLEVLYPDRDVSRLAGQFANDGSVVMRLTYASTSVMLMGDAPAVVESRLLATHGAHLKSDLLKAGHHGSRTSSSDAFVKAVSPSTALLSLEKNSRYHFPHPEPMAVFKKYGVSVARTDLEGALVYISDGKSFIRKK